MNERTTIGGTVYETVGSSSSNLLLRCNGTARIQWGNKLIDLVKNGKLASGDSPGGVFIISNESEIKSDGIYILNNETSSQLWICSKGKHYNLTGKDLYISASTKQDITVDQQKQVLENMNMYFNTIDDVINAGIKNGLIYIEELKKFYYLTDGKVELLQTMLVADSVEKLKNQEDLNQADQLYFTKGMIIMYLSTQPIPTGWAKCDGASYTYNGESVITPLIESNNDSYIFIVKL